MTGILNALIGARVGQPYTVTVADIGTGRGFFSGTAGAVSPTTLKGSSIRQVASNASPADFRFELSAVVSQTYFQALLVFNASGGTHRFRAAAATYSNPGGVRSLWQWSVDEAGGSGANVWPDGGSDGARKVIIYY